MGGGECRVEWGLWWGRYRAEHDLTTFSLNPISRYLWGIKIKNIFCHRHLATMSHMTVYSLTGIKNMWSRFICRLLVFCCIKKFSIWMPIANTYLKNGGRRKSLGIRNFPRFKYSHPNDGFHVSPFETLHS